MEAVTQTAQAARRYLAHFLMSGDDAARKTLVFSPTNAKKTSLSPSDVNPTPTKSSYEAPASHHDGYSRHTSTVATRGPATGADASRITTRFAREAQVAPPATRKRGAEPIDRDESHRDDWNEHPAGDAPHAIPDQSVTASAAFGVGNGHGHGNGNLKIKGILSRGMNVGYRVSVDGGKRRRDLSTEGDADDDTDESRASKKTKAHRRTPHGRRHRAVTWKRAFLVYSGKHEVYYGKHDASGVYFWKHESFTESPGYPPTGSFANDDAGGWIETTVTTTVAPSRRHQRTQQTRPA